jgi:hypothetical protein
MKIRSFTLAAVASVLVLPVTLQAADASSPAAPKADTRSSAASARKADTHCATTTQTRIRKSKTEGCNDVPSTRTYSREDLESTGQFDTGEALKRLDPRFH